MAFKPRTERQELIILRSLNARMELPEEDKRNFYNLKKGYEGEVMFDLLTEKIQSNCYILNDLLLEVNNSKFQIDTLIIKDTLHVFDVKNNEGDYYFENGEFYSKHGTKITTNPLDQLKRCNSLFPQLLQKHGFRIPLESNVVFINPNFTLYQAPKNEPLIFPTQINSLMKKLNTTTRNLTGKHKQLAELLDSLHFVESPYPRLLHYEYSQQRKGFICCLCQSFSVCVDHKILVCNDCGHQETVDAAVVRSVEELKLLFPDRKITTSAVMEWCEGVLSDNIIRRILNKYYKANGFGRWLFYE